MIIEKNLKLQKFGHFGNSNWVKSNDPVDYDFAIDWMQKKVKKIQLNKDINTVWLLEHKNIITGGALSKENELINKDNLPVRRTGRGGQWTWHGPGQRVIYIMMNLNNINRDVKIYIKNLEEVIIKTLKSFEIIAFRRQDFPGVWVESKHSYKLDKIASIGIRISRWVSYHGISVNINPSLKNFDNIIPCGIKNGGVTSLSKLGYKVTMNDFDKNFSRSFSEIFK